MRTWLTIHVELLSGGGADLWPYPGRVFAVGPSHTFHDLAQAIDNAFARWDLAHLHAFTIADGRRIDDPEDSDYDGPEPLDIRSAKVTRTVRPGDAFCYVFDFGDDWTHRCTVDDEKLDPHDAFGARLPTRPTPIGGWGSMPDQYGRRWADDDGTTDPPARPAKPDPMTTGIWPEV